eukprot:8866813-Lingulodinium_polyedra.AAC.1
MRCCAARGRPVRTALSTRPFGKGKRSPRLLDGGENGCAEPHDSNTMASQDAAQRQEGAWGLLPFRLVLATGLLG